jgi:hypothetical protein
MELEAFHQVGTFVRLKTLLKFASQQLGVSR